MKEDKRLKFLFLSWFSIAFPILEYVRSNLFILFDNEFSQLIIFILFLGVISIIIFVSNILFLNIEHKKLISFLFTLSLFFWNYKNISTWSFNFFNELNNSGILFFLIGLLISLFFLNKKNIYQQLFVFINFLLVVQLIAFVYTFLNLNYSSHLTSRANSNLEILNESENFKQNEQPDVYFFIFDAVANNKYNSDFHKVDLKNISKKYSNFQLELFENEYSEYGGTGYQLASILEMEPIQKNAEKELNSILYDRIFNTISNNQTRVERYFLNQGYTLFKYGLYFGTGCTDTEHIVCLDESEYNFSGVISQIIDQSPLRILKSKKIVQLDNSTSKLVKYLFFTTCGIIDQECEPADIKSLIDNQSIKTPKLYLMHFMFTHSPFYLDDTCKPYLQETESSKFDDKGYNDAIKCMYLGIENVLDTVSENSIIIIQSDHGPHKFHRDRTSTKQLRKEFIEIQYPILSFSNINKFCNKQIESFSGTNTFQHVINCLNNQEIFKIDSKEYYYYVIGPEYHEFIIINELIDAIKK